MLSVCIGCNEIFYDDLMELIDFLEDEDVDLHQFICEDCFFDLIGEPFSLDILGQNILFFNDDDLQRFLEDLEWEIA